MPFSAGSRSRSAYRATGSSPGRCRSRRSATSATWSDPLGSSPPTSGTSKPSSSSRSRRPMSRSVMSPTMGPRGDAMAAHNPLTTAPVSPRSTLRHAASRSTASATSAARSAASNAVRSKTPCTDRPHQRAPGHAGQIQRHRPPEILLRARPPRARGRSGGQSFVGGELLLRLAADRRLLVQRPGDARVRDTAPPDIERTVEHGGLQEGRVPRVHLPPGIAGRSTRSTDTRGPNAATAAATSSSVRFAEP